MHLNVPRSFQKLSVLATAQEETMQDDVTAVKKSRAASPAPKASKERDEKEVAKGASPSAEKPPKVEKSSEPVRTDKVKKLQLHFGKRAAIGVAALTALIAVVVALCFFMPAPLVKKLQLHFGKRAAIGVAALTALIAVVVALCFFMPAPLEFTLTSSYMIGGITLVGVALTAVAAVAVKKFNLKLPTRGKKQS
eukprot:Skav201678  [mRNA]  locus=scaffold641:421424:424003:+ [translate_table: standard]